MYFLIFLSFVFSLSAQDLSISTPYSTVYNHFHYLEKESYNPRKAANSFYIRDKNNAGDLAIKLKKYLDATGQSVDLESLPIRNDYTDSLRGISVFYLFPDNNDIYLEKIGNKWYYSKYTSSKIPDLYSSISPSGFEELFAQNPQLFKKIYLGLELWQYIGILSYLIISLILYIIIKRILNKYIIKLINKVLRNKIALEPISHASGPFSFLIIVFLISNFLIYLHLPISISKSIFKIIEITYPILLTYVFYRVTDVISDVFQVLASKTKSQTDDKLIPLVRKTIKIFVVLMGTFYLVNSLGINITPLLAGASIGGLALALAAQETIKNFFGSVTIFTDKPFEIGDYIVFDSSEGTVEDVGIRSTRIRTFYDSVIAIPNGKIADMKIDNMGKRKVRRYRTTLNLRFDTPIEIATEFVAKLKEFALSRERIRKADCEISINDITNSSLQVLIYIFFEVSNWTDELKEKQDFIVNVTKIADSLNVKFAYPTQSILIEEVKNQDSSNKDTNA